MSTTQYIIDASTRHQVFLQRYAGGESKKAIKLLMRLRREINARLSQEPTDFQRARLSIVLEDLNRLMADGYENISIGVKSDMAKLAESEADFSVNLYNKATNANFVLPSSEVLAAAVALPMAAPKGRGTITIDEALKEFGAKKAAQVTQIIADGLALGDNTPAISRKIETTINTLQRRQLDTLVRTAANHVSSVARSSVYGQNGDIIKGYKWIATLDNRTTLICASRDNKIFPVNANVYPPAHWGCRSTTIPVVKKGFDIGANLTGKRPSVGSAGAKEVSGRTTYGSWLKRQPKEFIDEALGVGRSKLFRSGKLSIEKFVDPTGRVYTLDQLRQMNPFAFAEN